MFHSCQAIVRSQLHCLPDAFLQEGGSGNSGRQSRVHSACFPGELIRGGGRVGRASASHSNDGGAHDVQCQSPARMYARRGLAERRNKKRKKERRSDGAGCHKPSRDRLIRAIRGQCA